MVPVADELSAFIASCCLPLAPIERIQRCLQTLGVDQKFPSLVFVVDVVDDDDAVAVSCSLWSLLLGSPLVLAATIAAQVLRILIIMPGEHIYPLPRCESARKRKTTIRD